MIKLPEVAVSLPSTTGILCRERGAKLQLVRIREELKRLFGKSVGPLSMAVMKQAPHSFQKPGWSPWRQTNDPKAIVGRGMTVTACGTVLTCLRLRLRS